MDIRTKLTLWDPEYRHCDFSHCILFPYKSHSVITVHNFTNDCQYYRDCAFSRNHVVKYSPYNQVFNGNELDSDSIVRESESCNSEDWGDRPYFHSVLNEEEDWNSSIKPDLKLPEALKVGKGRARILNQKIKEISEQKTRTVGSQTPGIWYRGFPAGSGTRLHLPRLGGLPGFKSDW